MKYITLLNRYFKGTKIAAFVLAMVMTVSLFMCVMTFSECYSLFADRRVLGVDHAERVFYLQKMAGNQVDPEGTAAQLSADSRIKQVYSIYTLKGVSYDGKNINVMVVQPELMALLPGLKELGINFEKDPDGCIVVGYQNRIGSISTGDTLILNVGKEKVYLPVNNRLAEGKYISFDSSSSVPNADILFSDNDTIIIQETENNLNGILAINKSVRYNNNILVQLHENVRAEEIKAIRSEKAAAYSSYCFSLAQLRNQKTEMLSKSLKQSLPRPLFLLCASLMAYLSILILTFKRQEKNLAMYYLCGASKKKSTVLTFTTFTIIALIPILLVVAFIVSWEPLNISGEINSMYRDYLREADKNGTHYTNMEELYPGWKGFVLEQFGGAIDNRIQKLINLDIKLVNLWIVFGFYGITALVAFLVAWLSMRKHSPLTYLRGVNE